jgi:myo-inositol-1(or 4)-monophosphatase
MPKYLETGVNIAHEAGRLLAEFYRMRVGFELKGDFDLVTEADRSSERLVVERLLANYPDHSIVAEEGGGKEGSSDYRWYVDPLDGTTNFAHGYPAFNVTLALARGDELIAGVVYDPLREEMFAAEKGSGAYMNDHKIHVSSAKRLADSLVSTGFPSRKRSQNVNIHFYHQLAMSTHGVRRGGSAALDLSYVACGRLEAFWEFGLNPWDLAAGTLLVTEAGGTCTDMRGRPHSLKSPHLLVDNGLIHGEMLEFFGEIFGGLYRHPMPPIVPS